MLNVLSLFSGVGGFDYGLENAGMKTVFQCEIDKHCQNILQRHWPDVPKWDDIQTLTGRHILENAGVVDVVAWGSPCQDLSVAGKRAGLAGESSGLFHEGIRIIKELRKESNGQYPRVSIWENVMGSLSSNGGADFGRVIDEMAEAGALVIEWRCLDARFFGIPQRRRRVFVIAVFDPAVARDCPDPILPVTRGVFWHSKTSAAKEQEAPREVRTSLDSNRAIIGSEVVGSLNTSDSKHISNQYVAENKCVVEPTVFQPGTMTRLGGGVWEGLVPTLRAEVKRGDNEPHIAIHAFDTQFGSNAAVFQNESPTLKSSQQSPSVFQEPLVYDGYNQTISAEGIHRSLRVGRDSSDFIAQPTEPTVFEPGAMARLGGRVWEGTTPTLRANAGDNHPHIQIHNVEPTMAVRRLTPLECERLMGWPDNWTDGQSDSHRYKQCGNGVASPVAEWIGEQILKIWSKHE